LIQDAVPEVLFALGRWQRTQPRENPTLRLKYDTAFFALLGVPAKHFILLDVFAIIKQLM